MQNMGLSIVALSQGVPFFQAGSDMLRSKSLDRNSYNSGDWFNRLDFSYKANYWGVGLPPAGDNESNWPLMQPLLARADLVPSQEQILRAVDHFQEMLQIRKRSPLFRLQTADQVTERLTFHNTGPFQVPGLIVMSLSDIGDENLDPNYGLIVVLFNANKAKQQFTEDLFSNLPLRLHPVQLASSDSVVQTAAFDPTTAIFSVPGRTTAVFVLAEADTNVTELVPSATPVPMPEPTAEPTASPESTLATTTEPAAAPTTEPAPTVTPGAERSGSAWPWLVGGGLLLALGVGYLLTRRR